MDPLLLLKYWFLACCQFCEKWSFFPNCYGQFSVIFCALFASASGKKTIARVTRIGNICRILFDILTPDRLYSSWMSLPFVDFFALGASFFDPFSQKLWGGVGGSRWSQDGPRWSQDGPRWSQHEARWSQDGRRRKKEERNRRKQESRRKKRAEQSF